MSQSQKTKIFGNSKKPLAISNKAQIKLWTTISILIIFFVILMISFIFYARFEEIGIRRAAEREEALRAVRVAQVAANLPELKCLIGTVEKGACFDLYKLDASVDVMNTEFVYYYDYFGFAEITVEKIIPGSPPQSWVLYSNPGGKNSSHAAQIPVSIYDVLAEPYPKFYFGVLEVRSYY